QVEFLATKSAVRSSNRARMLNQLSVAIELASPGSVARAEFAGFVVPDAKTCASKQSSMVGLPTVALLSTSSHRQTSFTPYQKILMISRQPLCCARESSVIEACG